MNLLLFKSAELLEGRFLDLEGRRAVHLIEVLKLGVGDSVKAACLGEGLCEARVSKVRKNFIQLDVSPRQSVSERNQPDLTLLVALPRPQMLKRVLQVSAQFGVREIVFIGSKKVEKSFFQSKELLPERLEANLLLGLEQSSRYLLPKVRLERSIWSYLANLDSQFYGHKLLAEPGPWGRASSIWDISEKKPVLMAVGPEGGWVESELAGFLKAGFERVSLSQNVLRVDQAVTIFLSQVEDSLNTTTSFNLDDSKVSSDLPPQPSLGAV